MENEVKDTLQSIAKKVEKHLYFKVAAGNRQCVYDAMNYSLQAGGKRIRPVLVLEFCRIYGGDTTQAMETACALEMIHTFSLIHDDLPEMDNDDYRRGKPSCHKAFDHATALQAGDALFAGALERVANDTNIDDTKRAEIMRVLLRETGAAGMIGGQILDMSLEHKNGVIVERLEDMVALKTCALLSAACELGVILADGTEQQRAIAKCYGYNMGMAFQIVDDILDVTSTSEVLGKPVGSDAEEGKNTFVTILGLEGAKELAATYTDRALECADVLPNNEFLINLTKALLQREK